MRASWVVMLVMGVLACAGLALMMSHLKGMLSSESAGFDPLITALQSRSASPPSVVLENHDGLRVLRVRVQVSGKDPKREARSIGELAWEKVGPVQSLDGVVVLWSVPNVQKDQGGRGGGSLEVPRPVTFGRSRGQASRSSDSRPESRSRPMAAPGR